MFLCVEVNLSVWEDVNAAELFFMASPIKWGNVLTWWIDWDGFWFTISILLVDAPTCFHNCEEKLSKTHILESAALEI